MCVLGQPPSRLFTLQLNGQSLWLCANPHRALTLQLHGQRHGCANPIAFTLQLNGQPHGCANPIAFTLQLKGVLRRVIPVLGNVKDAPMRWVFKHTYMCVGNVKDAPMRWVFSTALGRFAEAMAHFQANATAEQKKLVSPGAFATDLGSSFDIIFTRWLNAKENQVKLAVAEALGYIAPMVDKESLSAHLPKVLAAYLNLLKTVSPADHLPVNAGFGMILTVAVQEDHRATMVEFLPQVLAALHSLVVEETDHTKANLLKNQNELLRTFENLARGYPDEVIEFVIARFQEKTKAARMASLLVLRHFVNSLTAEFSDKKELIISSVNSLTETHSLELRKAILQLIVSMSNHNYLPLEGGQNLVLFVLKQCALPDDETKTRKKTRPKQQPRRRRLQRARNRSTTGPSATQPHTSCPSWRPKVQDDANMNMEEYVNNHVRCVMCVACLVTCACACAVSCALRVYHVRCGMCVACLSRALCHVRCVSSHVCLRVCYVMCVACLVARVLCVRSCSRSSSNQENRYRTERVLWPFLLEFIADPAFQEALPVLAKAVGHLGANRRKADPSAYRINFDKYVNIPSAEKMLALCVVKVADPLQAPDFGTAMLKMMEALGPLIHPAVGAHWDETLPSLQQHLNDRLAPGAEPGFDKLQWTDTLLKVFTQTLAKVPENSFKSKVGNALMAQHTALYKGNHPACRVTMRYLGALCASVENKKLVAEAIDHMLCKTDHKSELEREGCSQGLGLCSYAHLDAVLGKILEKMTPKTEEAPKKSGWSLFGSAAPKSSSVSVHVLSTVALSYGYVASYANPDTVLSRLDVNILHNLVPLMSKASDVGLRLALIKAVGLIGASVHPKQLPEGKQKFKLSQRDEMFTQLLSYVTPAGSKDKDKDKDKMLTNDMRLAALQSMVALASLTPKLDNALREKLYQVGIPFLRISEAHPEPDKAKRKKEKKEGEENGTEEKLGGKADKAKAKATPAKEKQKNGEEKTEAKQEGEGEDEEEKESAQHVEIVANLEALFLSILEKDPTVASLAMMLDALLIYVNSPSLLQRKRTLNTLLQILKKFIQISTSADKVSQSEKSLPSLGAYIGQILPRAFEKSAACRHVACELIQALLYTQQLLANPDNPKPSPSVKLLTPLKAKLAGALDARLALAVDVCGIIADLLSPTILIEMTQELIEGLSDPDAEAVQGSAALLQSLIQRVGSELNSALSALITAFINQLQLNNTELSRQCALETFRTLTKHHISSVLDNLVKSKVPLAPSVVDCFVCLVDSDDTNLAKKTLQYLYTTMNQTPILEKGPTPVVQTVTCVFGHILKVEKISALLRQAYSALFCSLLMRIGTAQGCDDGESSKDAIASLKVFLKAVEEDELLDNCEKNGVFALLAKPKYDDAVTELTKLFCQVHPKAKRPLLKFLANFYSQQSFTGQRVVATSMLAQFVMQSGDDLVLLRELVKFLLPRAVDQVPKIRKQALRGLGNLKDVWSEEVALQAGGVLASLTSASEDKHAEVAAEAVASLTRICSVVSPETIASMLINICFRVRPAFDRKDADIRKAAFALFAELCRFGADSADAEAIGGIKNNFVDQVHSMLPLFLVHLADEKKEVAEECCTALKRVGQLMSKAAQDVINTANTEPEQFGDLAHGLMPVIVQENPERLRGYIDTIADYFKSKWVSIQAHACTLAGELLAATKPEDQRLINVRQMVEMLTGALKSPEEPVRIQAAKALGLLHNL
eukprot:g49339.t1